MQNKIITMEIFKDIPNYIGIYQASNLGRIKSLKFGKERILKFSLDKYGYLTVCLIKNGIKKNYKSHKLVAEVFLNHIPCGYKSVVNHINFDKLDNRVENLEIVSQRENANKKHLKSTSKYVGISWHKCAEKWQARIFINNKSKYLGLFIDELEAHKTYQKALLILKTDK